MRLKFNFYFILDKLLNLEYNNHDSVNDIFGVVNMFIGRQNELSVLDECYNSEQFQFLVMYGRRRVGKTYLLQEFSKIHKTIFFSAQEKNDALNLEDFSKTILNFFGDGYFGNFSGWEAAFRYIGDKCGNDRIVLIIDEFPFIASENPSVKSILQHTIDHIWKQKNIFLILCGSSVSFMENEVMGYKSPLYGRSTGQMEIKAFDYLDSTEFFPDYSNIDKLLAYGILGGIPCYLESFDNSISIEKNISDKILRTGSFLRDEPQLLLKMELREPAVYNSIFEVIAEGASRINDISLKTHEESQKCSKYLSTLQNIKLIERIIPCGEKASTKKSLYKISDNFYQFWYKYIFANRSYYEMLGKESAASEIMRDISSYMGGIFESICQQYMIRLARAKKLPFIPHDIGRWWGTNPKTKGQDDIDILCLSRDKKSAVFCECKFRNVLFDMKEYNDLMTASEIIKEPENRYYYLFSKSGFTDDVKMQAKENGAVLVELDDLFSI